MSAEFSPFRLDRIERFAAALGPIRSHRMDRVMGMSWGALRVAMDAESIGRASATRRRSAMRLFAALTSYRRLACRVDGALSAIFASALAGIVSIWLVARPNPIFGCFAVAAIADSLLTVRVVFAEWRLFSLRRHLGVTREEIAFALSEIVSDSRWEKERNSTDKPGASRTLGRSSGT